MEETSFEVRRQGLGDASYFPIATVAASVTTYQDTSVSADDQFCYQVIARNAMGDSGPSNISCAIPPSPGLIDLVLQRAKGLVRVGGSGCRPV